jgi:hypothetical protein
VCSGRRHTDPNAVSSAHRVQRVLMQASVTLLPLLLGGRA